VTEYKWRKASRSGAQGDNCVEVAINVLGVVAVRDSKEPDGGMLIVSAEEWRGFVLAARGGFGSWAS
jgi:hypothetical protein